MKNTDDDDSRCICDKEKRIWKATQENTAKRAMEELNRGWIVDGRCDCEIDCRRELLAQSRRNVPVPPVSFANVALGGAANDDLAAHLPQGALDQFPAGAFVRATRVLLKPAIKLLTLSVSEKDVLGILRNTVPNRLRELDPFSERHVEELINRYTCHETSLPLGSSGRPTFRRSVAATALQSLPCLECPPSGCRRLQRPSWAAGR